MRLMFRCTQAYVKSESAAGMCEFWIDDLGAQQVARPPAKVDLTRRPSQGVAPDEIQVDDLRQDGGFSYLVPEPKGGTWTDLGALYIEDGYWRSLGLAVVPVGPKAYELSGVYYTPDDKDNPDYAGRRYHGFHACVLERKEQFVRCAIWPAGSSQASNVRPVETWIDLSAPLDCDANAKIEPEAWPEAWPRISIEPPRDGEDAGVLYLDTERAGALLLEIPKLPPRLEQPVPTAQTLASDARSDVSGAAADAWAAIAARQPAPGRPLPRRAELRRTFDPRPGSVAGKRTGFRLSVSSSRPTNGLLEVQRIVAAGGHLALVDDLAGLATLLRAAVASRPKRVRRRLDLIGHSATEDHLLMLGDTMLDARNGAVLDTLTQIAREELLPLLGIETIGIVGCQTAQSDAARFTISVMRDLLDVDVQAPCDMVTADEFDAGGFTGKMGNLRRACPVVTWPTADFAGGFGADVLSVNRPAHADRVYVLRDGEAGFSLAAVKRRLFDPTAGGWRKSGLLARADVHVVVAPRSGAPDGVSSSFEILGGYRLVRVYPRGSDDAVIYRVADPAGLRHLVEDGRAVIPVSDRIEHAA